MHVLTRVYALPGRVAGDTRYTAAAGISARREAAWGARKVDLRADPKLARLVRGVHGLRTICRRATAISEVSRNSAKLNRLRLRAAFHEDRATP